MAHCSDFHCELILNADVRAVQEIGKGIRGTFMSYSSYAKFTWVLGIVRVVLRASSPGQVYVAVNVRTVLLHVNKL